MVMKFFKTLMFAALALLATACKPTSIDDVTRRISEGKELSQEDYKIMLDYSLESLSRTSDSIMKHSDDRIALARSVQFLATEYPEATLVNRTLETTDTAKLDASNRALYEKFIGTRDDLVQRFNDIMYGGVDPRVLINGRNSGGVDISVETSDSSALVSEEARL